MCFFFKKRRHKIESDPVFLSRLLLQSQKEGNGELSAFLRPELKKQKNNPDPGFVNELRTAYTKNQTLSAVLKVFASRPIREAKIVDLCGAKQQ